MVSSSKSASKRKDSSLASTKLGESLHASPKNLGSLEPHQRESVAQRRTAPPVLTLAPMLKTKDQNQPAQSERSGLDTESVLDRSWKGLLDPTVPTRGTLLCSGKVQNLHLPKRHLHLSLF